MHPLPGEHIIEMFENFSVYHQISLAFIIYATCVSYEKVVVDSMQY